MNIIEQLKIYEGTKQYQTKLGYYRDGKFWTYKDSLGYRTIGYGHLVKSDESFTNGLTEEQATRLLESDLAIASREVAKLNVNLPSDSRWNDFLVLMIFQLGVTKTLQFKKFLAALRSGNYATAVIEVKDSNWYMQTPNRVNDMIRVVVNG